MKLTQEDFLTIEVLRELDAAMRAAGIARGVAITPLDLSAGTTTMPTAAFVNIIEENLRHLGATDTRIWHGEDRDSPRLDHTDVNRWFASAIPSTDAYTN